MIELNKDIDYITIEDFKKKTVYKLFVDKQEVSVIEVLEKNDEYYIDSMKNNYEVLIKGGWFNGD